MIIGTKCAAQKRRVYYEEKNIYNFDRYISNVHVCGSWCRTNVCKSKKIKLSTKKVTLYKGKTKTIKLKYANKKVKWKIKNKKIAKNVKKSGKKTNTVEIKGLKKGSAKLIATCGKKKFTTKIVIKVLTME